MSVVIGVIGGALYAAMTSAPVTTTVASTLLMYFIKRRWVSGYVGHCFDDVVLVVQFYKTNCLLATENFGNHKKVNIGTLVCQIEQSQSSILLIARVDITLI